MKLVQITTYPPFEMTFHENVYNKEFIFGALSSIFIGIQVWLNIPQIVHQHYVFSPKTPTITL